MAKYLFKGTDISTIIQSGNVTPSGFSGFPTSDSTNFQILKPLPLYYISGGKDVAD